VFETPAVENDQQKTCGARPAGLHPRESGSEVVQELGVVTATQILLGPTLVWSQQNYLNILLTVSYSKSSSGCCPSDPP